MDKDFFAERLKYFRSQKDLTQTELADLTGITAKQISDYEVGRSKPRPATLFKILTALKMDETSFFDTDIFMSSLINHDDNSLIFTSDTNKTIILPKQRFYFNIQYIIVHEHQGDSMTPTLNDGDLLLVNTDVMRIDYGALYLLNLDNNLIIYRLYPNGDGTTTGKKDNEFYPPMNFSLDKINIIGKVIYRQGFL